MCEVLTVHWKTAATAGFTEMNRVEDDHSHVPGIRAVTV